jgi:predicted transcriptional regulator
MSKHNKIIKKIENVRKKNNVQWMNILRIAIKSSPKETKKVINKINTNDKIISQLVSKLSGIK